MKRSTTRLEGDLGFFPIFDLLQWLEQAGKTGMLRIQGAEGERNVCLKEGRIIFASSRCPGQRFGEFLASRGSIREADLRKALEASRRDGRTFTRYLVEENVVSREDLERGVFELIQNILEDIFESHEEPMRFSFVDALPSIVSEGVIQFQSAHLIMETVRRLDERRRDQERNERQLELRREEFSRGAFDFPEPPAIIGSLLRRPTGRWVEDVLGDPVRTAELQRLAASGALGDIAPGDKEDPSHLLTRLGPAGTAGILAALALRGLITGERNRDRVACVMRHCLESAFIARALAPPAGIDVAVSYLAGLVHELGKTVILEMEEAAGMSEQDLNLFMTEAHLRVGVQIAEKWRLSREVQAAVRYQYNFRMGGAHRRLAALVQVAHSLASDPDGHDRRLRLDEEAVRFLGVEAAEAEAAGSRIREALSGYR